MKIRDYADVLRFAINTQIKYVEEEVPHGKHNEDYLDGIIAGLRMALKKIDASMFLAEKE
jgi:hypothetical protein